MALTGWPIIVVAAVLALGAGAATVLTWRRHRRLAWASRALAVLVCETLALLTTGLIVNQREQFYPSWAALFESADHTPVATAKPTVGLLDEQIAARVGNRGEKQVSVLWPGASWAAWHLAGPPTLVVPQVYLHHPTWSFPVVLAFGPAGAPEVSAIRVVVKLRPGADGAALGAQLPAELAKALRVQPHGWALVTSRVEERAAFAAVDANPATFGSLALVDDAGAPLPVRAQLPPEISVAVVGTRQQAAKPGPAGVTVLAGTPADRWRTAVAWAAGRTPQPLAPAQVLAGLDGR
jgi:hypothetical protein